MAGTADDPADSPIKPWDPAAPNPRHCGVLSSENHSTTHQLTPMSSELSQLQTQGWNAYHEQHLTKFFAFENWTRCLVRTQHTPTTYFAIHTS